MTDLEGTPAIPSGREPYRAFCRDSVGRRLLEAAAEVRSAPAVAGPPGQVDDDAGALTDALSADAAGRIDADAVAEWITSRYRAASYPAVVLGSPHGAAVHLAAALGAPWLPTTFTVTARRPDGAVDDWHDALEAGTPVARQLRARNRTVTVRQVHDPLRGGPAGAATVTLHVRWSRLPPAYRSFLKERVEPGAASLLLRDVRIWPVLETAPGCSFQVGSPAGGRQPADYTPENVPFGWGQRGPGADRWARVYRHAVRRYTELAGDPQLERELRELTGHASRPTHRVLYSTPESLSACIADLYRDWLREQRGEADRCIVETERLVDPRRVLTAGLVPYWCEAASRSAATGAAWWLAGSRPFDTVEVLPVLDRPLCDRATPAQWQALAAFGRRGPAPPGRPAGHPAPPRVDAPGSSRLDPDRLLGGLRRRSVELGMLVL